jgi:hypothetical protein
VSSIDKALSCALYVHGDVKDKSGQPYILHPLRVMAAVEGEDAKVAAILHDVLEDSSMTADDLRSDGFAEPVIEAVLCLTHRESESYADYVVRCKGNEVARRVKLADLEDNSRPARAILRPERLDSDMARLRKYFLSYKFLVGQLTELEYRETMKRRGSS